MVDGCAMWLVLARNELGIVLWEVLLVRGGWPGLCDCLRCVAYAASPAAVDRSNSAPEQ
jgi:hypothetical protein